MNHWILDHLFRLQQREIRGDLNTSYRHTSSSFKVKDFKHLTKGQRPKVEDECIQILIFFFIVNKRYNVWRVK